jgi:hypothetical protein
MWNKLILCVCVCVCVVLEFELRALRLLGRFFTTWAPLLALFFLYLFFE